MHPLKVFRAKRGLNQGELAAMLDVARPSVTRWENGTRKIDVDKLPLIFRVTGIPAHELRPDLAAMFSEAAE